jgi:uncharacterized protein (UPF0335 family)
MNDKAKDCIEQLELIIRAKDACIEAWKQEIERLEAEVKAGRELWIDAQKRCKKQALRGDRLKAEARQSTEAWHIEHQACERLERENEELKSILAKVERVYPGIFKTKP